MNNTVKAIVAQVRLGQVEFEGIQFPDGGYGVAIPQVARLFSFPPNYASQELRRLLGNDFRPHKIKTELGNQLINVISLLDFEKALTKLDRKGNIKAQDFRDTLVGLSLNELFNDAFGIDNTSKTRQKYLEEKTLLTLREELTLVHGGFQAKCVNLNFCARHIHDYATKKLVGRTAKESIQELPINPEFTDYEKYSRHFIGINHVTDEEVKFLESLIKFKKYFSNKRPRKTETWISYTDRVLNLV